MNQQPVYLPMNMPYIELAIQPVQETPAPLCVSCLSQHISSTSAYAIDSYRDYHYHVSLTEGGHLDKNAVEERVWTKLVEEQTTIGPVRHSTMHVCTGCTLDTAINLPVESPLLVLPDPGTTWILFYRPINQALQRYAIFPVNTAVEEIVATLSHQDPDKDMFSRLVSEPIRVNLTRIGRYSTVGDTGSPFRRLQPVQSCGQLPPACCCRTHSHTNFEWSR